MEEGSLGTNCFSSSCLSRLPIFLHLGAKPIRICTASSSRASEAARSPVDIVMEKQSMSIYLRDLERITKGFSDQLKIGSGGYGEVYKGVYKGEEIAVKMLHNDLAFEDKTFENEFANLMRINHPNIVRLIGYCYETQHKHVEYKGELRFSQYTYRILCFEYMQGGSLDKYLKESRDHDWQTRYKITKGICEGLYFLHRGWSTPIFHLDLKPANILLDKSLAPKIADFGLSKLFNGTHTYTAGTCTGSIEYMPPEFLKNRHVSEKYDVYSLGIIIIQIIAGRTGYSEFSEMEDAPRFIELVNRNWSQYIDATTSPCPSSELDQVDTCIKMAIECVDPERKNRPTIAKILHILNETEKRFPVEWRNRAQFLDKVC
uniref:Uncharacterized protein n=1 Tax=Avena sativa TaxID=4498 RepID=A0ACD5ZFE9_AVESA